MGTIIAVVNQKGGVGKTTTAMNLMAALSDMGQRCLFVDLDPQANATSGLGFSQRDIEHGIYEVLGGDHTAEAVMQQVQGHDFMIIPATESLAGANVELVNAEDREFLLERVLGPLKNQYDYIFIDCPPSLGLLTINGLVASDEILIPVQAEYFALEGLGQLVSTIDRVREHIKPTLKIKGAVITMYDKRYNLSESVLWELYQHFPGTIFRTVIPRNVRLAEAPSHGRTIFGYDPSSRGARAYERLAREFLNIDQLIS
ncbi:MAG: ParA family protein [bacterium]|nr:ParA family protein [bacterium]